MSVELARLQKWFRPESRYRADDLADAAPNRTPTMASSTPELPPVYRQTPSTYPSANGIQPSKGARAEQKVHQVRKMMKTIDADADTDRQRFEGFLDRVVDRAIFAGDEENPTISQFVNHVSDEFAKDERSRQQEEQLFEVTKQKIQNLKFQTPLLEHEEALRQLHRQLLQEAENQRQDLSALHQKGADQLALLDANVRCPILVTYTSEQLVSENALSMPLEELRALAAAAHPDLVLMQRLLDELLEPSCNRRRRDAIEGSLKENVPILRTPILAELAIPIFDLLHSDLLNTGQIRAQLFASDDVVKRLQHKVEQLEQAREQALNDDDMMQAERLHMQSIDMLADLMAAIQSRLQTLGGETNSLGSMLRRFIEHAQRAVAEWREQEAEIQRRCEEDLAKVARKDRSQVAENDAHCNQFDIFREASNAALSENMQRQDEVYAKVCQLYEQLRELGEARWQQVTERVDALEREERRKEHYASYCRASDEHQRMLRNVLQNCSECLTAMSALETFLQGGTELVAAKYEASERELKDLRLDEQRNHLSVFRRYYLTVGELLFKKEKRLQELDRLQRHAELQVQMARDTLDSNIKQYRDQAHVFEEETNQLSEVVNALREKADQAKDDFEETSEALRRDGVQFLHPAIELQEQNVQRRAKLNQLKKKYADKDKEDCEHEEEDVKKLHATTKQAKKSGLASLINPLSPNRPNKYGVAN
eukprot:TRINITY_DN2876_c0_g1_i1.p1 TRINITY_DN2876_c0_g1~~TRINITY_DN2876_c0_g1_i1.p1  ORF type:complete len:738 (-),score=195.57 TRINITY_DN2876_c0_g1_i1:77-2212(-)